MADEIRDLDDVEAQAWATIYAHWSSFAHESAAGHADEGLRLLRQRRAPAEDKIARMGAEWAASVGAERERAAIVAWLRSVGVFAGVVDAIERGEHER